MNKKIIGIFICTLMIAVVFPVAGTGNGYSIKRPNEFDYKQVLVRIDTSKSQATLPRGVEIVSSNSGEWVDIIIPDYRLKELSNSQLTYSILINDMDAYDKEMMGSYHTFAQIQSMLQNIASSYPDITSLYSIGTSYEGREIWCLEITDNPGVDEGEPGVFYMGLHHAREWPTVEICLNIANQLTSQYGSDPDITDVVNNRRLWLVPCMNPDGYYYCHDLGNDWRKNRHYFSEYGTYGVDLNRNYGGSSDGDIWGAWGSIGSGSVTHGPGDETYCGPGINSELETQAIRNVFLENDICASITWHTYQETVMWPWGYKPGPAPDSSYLASVGTQIAQRITQQDGSGTYTPQQSCVLYPTTGDTTDWAYGYGQYVQGRTTFAYTIEACADFHPSASYLDQICTENFHGALYLLQEAENIRDTVVPRVMPPVVDEMTNDSDGNYVVSWEEQNPNANPDYFQLDEMTGLSVSTDGAESGSGLWTLDGFALSTSRYHSGSYSYKSRHSNSDVSSMTSLYPIPITNGMKLSFWCWYATEQDYDYAFVEVSKDGRFYDVIDTFTGSSSWTYKEYNLDEYAGKSIFIRFRYTTDSYTLQEGFYVDDISPVANFGSVTTLSNSITNNYYEITNKPDGIYYYRVKGHNSARGWCDFSTLGSIRVEYVENDPPNTPSITGAINGKIGQAYVYNFVTIDPDGDNVYYYMDWGDDTNSGWLGSYASGLEKTANHTWSEQGTYIIKIKAKDTLDAESDWATLSVTMPLNLQSSQQSLNQLFLKMLERFYLSYQIR
ncbi:MAG: M14 family zinc carboxypeptidase [Euryarchaeota archaeon]|nr:M14 family zinc carboxypeptidase [Euryarchaeota archaeon]